MLAQRCPICCLKENYQLILPSYTGCGARGAQQAGSLRDDVLMDASYFNGQYCSILFLVVLLQNRQLHRVLRYYSYSYCYCCPSTHMSSR